MGWSLVSAVVVTAIALIYMSFIPLKEDEIVHLEGQPKRFDFKGTIAVINTIPGMFALIFFTTINNFIGGAFMALMDPYGLSLMSVQKWGVMLGVLSFGFVIG